MTGPLASFGRDWQALADYLADFQAGLLRRTAGEMADAVDAAARRDIEGVREWRDLRKETRYAATHS